MFIMQNLTMLSVMYHTGSLIVKLCLMGLSDRKRALPIAVENYILNDE